MQKLKDEVTISGELLTAMFNFMSVKGTYAEVSGMISEFNKQVEDFLVEMTEEEVEEALEKSNQSPDKE